MAGIRAAPGVDPPMAQGNALQIPPVPASRPEAPALESARIRNVAAQADRRRRAAAAAAAIGRDSDAQVEQASRPREESRVPGCS